MRILMEHRRDATTTGSSNERTTQVGLEVKSGQSPYHGTQRTADSMLPPNNLARVRLNDGRTIEITEVQMKRVEKRQIDALPTKQMAKMS